MSQSDDPRRLAAAARLAVARLTAANARLINRHSPVGEAGSPERAEWAETLVLIWDAMCLLAPDACHPEDGAAARAEIDAALLSASSHPR